MLGEHSYQIWVEFQSFSPLHTEASSDGSIIVKNVFYFLRFFLLLLFSCCLFF